MAKWPPVTSSRLHHAAFSSCSIPFRRTLSKHEWCHLLNVWMFIGGVVRLIFRGCWWLRFTEQLQETQEVPKGKWCCRHNHTDESQDLLITSETSALFLVQLQKNRLFFFSQTQVIHHNFLNLMTVVWYYSCWHIMGPEAATSWLLAAITVYFWWQHTGQAVGLFIDLIMRSEQRF